ncbi:MAG: methionyl-tRNA formyltransferase [Limnochordia bacterium]|jgi:methionyl-tRNA formyltransferase
MRLVFMGTPEFAVPSLAAIVEAGFAVLAVVTQPDRPQGRGMRVSPPPVKEKALELGLPILQPQRLSDSRCVTAISEMRPDAIVVVAFGQFLPKALLNLPPRGCINVHPSLLPLYRGASPIQQAILDGVAETGVTTMYLDEGMDTGDVIAQVATPIGDEDDAGSLHDRLASIGAGLLVETLQQVIAGTVLRRPQDHSLASVTKRLKREDGSVDWNLDSATVANQVRAFSPWPGAFTVLDGRRVKIWRAVTGSFSVKSSPGCVIAVSDEGLEVACGRGTLLVQELQPENSKRMLASSFARGYRVTTATCFQGRT